MLYEISDEQLKNLVIFMERATIKGSEVLAYISILQSLRNPIKKDTKLDKLDKLDKGGKIVSEVK